MSGNGGILGHVSTAGAVSDGGRGAWSPSDASRRRVAIGVAVVAVTALLAGCWDNGGDEPTASPSTSATPTQSPTPTPDLDTTTLTVYYTLDTRGGIKIAREIHEVETADPLVSAVERMIAGPDDPDYMTTWNPATEVLGVTHEGDLITVDLSEDARTANAGSAGAMAMIQQLAYTVTDTAGTPDAQVMLTIEGEPAGDLWGTLVMDKPITRDAPIDVRLLVQIDDPVEGATVTSPVTVTGEAAVFEATLPWSVLDGSGAEVASGVTMTAEGQTFAPYSFEVPLEPGRYTVVVTEDDPSDGEAGAMMTDSRVITVE